MNVTTITIDQETARQKLREYYTLLPAQRTPEDNLLSNAYRAAADGFRLINIYAAFKSVGLNERGQPKLAIARADWGRCVFHPHTQIGAGYTGAAGYARGAGLFTQSRRINQRLRVNCVGLPPDTFDRSALTQEILFSSLPHIPPELRPRPSALSRYHILFEVEQWQTYPVDPFLLRHIAGPFYAVEGEWELTALEASLLSALTP